MLRLVLQSLKKPTHQGVCSHTTDTIASAGAVSSLTVLAPVLEHVIKQLDDIRNLRLTARLFRYHPAIVWGCEFAWIDDDLSLQQGKAAISFLQRLPRLQKLHLEKPKTLLGLQSLTQLQLLELAECQQFTLA